jgi:uncharacterized protein
MNKNALNRRNFIRLSAAGAAGGLMLKQSPAFSAPPEGGTKSAAIITRTLGRTGLKLPVVSLGVMRTDNPSMVTRALEAGILLIDTANGYQNGKSEEMLGNLLKTRPRDSFYLETKISARGMDLTEEAFREKFDVSLKRLQMDYVDILYLHGSGSREMTLNPTYMKVLEALKKEGKIRFIGVSTHENMAGVLRAAVEGKIYDVVLTSWNFQLAKNEDVIKALAEANAAGLGIVAMKTMAGGFFDRDRKEPVNAKAALKWALQNEHIHTSIPGCTAFDQLEDNISLMTDIALTPDDLKALKLDSATTTLFCKGCQECKKTCPKGLPIPDMMRAYMYSYSYRDLSLAKEVVDRANLPQDVCNDCAVCSVQCSQGFDVRAKLADIGRLSTVPSDLLV